MLSVIVVMVPLTLPKLFGYRIYGVLTGSMTPAYSVGSVVYIQPCEPEEIQIGDVITFQLGTDTEYIMTHRVMAVDEEECTFTTKGDANDAADPELVRWERLIGKAVFCVPGLANVSNFADSATGKAVLFSVFALTFILWGVADMIDPKKRNTKRTDKKQETKEAATEVGISEEIQEKPTERKAGHGRGAVQSLIRAFGILLIVGAMIYLGSIFLQYRRSETEYEDLQKLVFSNGVAENDRSADGEAYDDEEEHLAGTAIDSGLSETDRQILDAIAALRKQNEDVIGWITFDNMELSYPIMHTDDNTYYLTHTFSGETNSAGSIFMEAGNSSDFNDCHTIIYGHNMKNLSMFGQLKKYKTEEFYEQHQFFTIYTLEQVYRYQIFAYYDISELGEIYTIGFEPNEEFGEFVEDMLKRSYYDAGVEISTQDKVITLSTCSGEGKRFVINAKRIEQ